MEQQYETIVIEKDGEMFCAYHDGHQSDAVADSCCGFGRSPMDALYNLLVIEDHNDAVFGQIMQMMIRRVKS
jgi:hypothetical protein